MQTVKIIMGKIPTIIVTGKPEKACRKPLRSGKISVGMAKVAGWKRSPEGRRHIASGRTMATSGISKVLEDLRRLINA